MHSIVDEKHANGHGAIIAGCAADAGRRTAPHFFAFKALSLDCDLRLQNGRLGDALSDKATRVPPASYGKLCAMWVAKSVFFCILVATYWRIVNGS